MPRTSTLVTPFGGYNNNGSPSLEPSDHVPAAPTGLTIAAISSSQVDLDWQDATTDEIGSEIQRRVGGDSLAFRATTAADATRCSDAELLPEATFDYRVRALGENGASPFTEAISVRTLPAPRARRSRRRSCGRSTWRLPGCG